MVKRKREDAAKEPHPVSKPTKVVKAGEKSETSSVAADPATLNLQIITGSYERVLHGFTAAIPTTVLASTKENKSSTTPSPVQFVDTFLFEAHSSAIRCLALSPLPKADAPEEQRNVILASGGTDERVNIYSVSAAPIVGSDLYAPIPSLGGKKFLENPKNRELGALLHHESSITAVCIPSRSKILAASEDNTISVNRIRDLSVVSSIKAPRPKTQGRPSGDTAPIGGAPSGVNDFAVHPSMKLMLSVGKGEKCMRLWNLVTGKKAGVLNFGREILQSVKEGKWSTGEGRKIVWNSKGDEFAVAFEWGVVVFGVDSTPICRVFPNPRSKVHQLKYVALDASAEDSEELLAVSTEDARVIFYSTKKVHKPEDEDDSPIPYAEAVAQIGGRACGVPGRVKDFDILSLQDEGKSLKNDFLVTTGNSEGAVRVWYLRGEELMGTTQSKKTKGEKGSPVPQVGKLLGAYETGYRITCLKAFVMLAPEEPSALVESEESEEEESESDDE
ncbi:WD40-repeat-containing domain protein [Aspergillus ambiguus]|uniref:putative 60S ribosome biogenesis protein Mak11 n=1 Tax=Aspergillus ambiguus TaxID=176160 RepID=UPI003CCCEC4A